VPASATRARLLPRRAAVEVEHLEDPVELTKAACVDLRLESEVIAGPY